MNTQLNNVKIALRHDTLKNWNLNDNQLLKGEYAAAVLEDGTTRIKIGDGVHTFNELPFIGSCVSVISGDVPFSNDLSVVKLTNEEYNKLVAEEKINPAALYVITDNYTSMRGIQLKDLKEPTDDTDAATKYYVDSSISGIQPPDLTPYVKKVDVNLSYVKNDKKIYLSADNNVTYIDTQDFIKDGMLSSAELCGNILVLKFNTDAGTTPISVNLSSFANVYSAGYGLNLINGQFSVDTSKIAEITDLTAYETKADLTANYYTKNQTSSNVELNNKFNNIYTKSETSSAIELRNRFDNIIKVGNYLNSTGYSLSSSDLSVVGISEEDYLKLVADERQDDKILYVVSSDNLNARNERVVNVAEPITDDDAATKHYVDGKLLYKITTKDVTLSSVNIDGSDVQAYVVYVDNNAINVIQLHSNSYPLFVYLPKQLEENYVRDLLVRVEVYTATAPSIGFFGISEVCEFESEDDKWMTLEPGVNMFNFTETRK